MEQTDREAAGRIVLDRMRRLAVGEGVSHDRMVVFPVFTAPDERDPGELLDYRTIDEAVAGGWVEVTEKPTASVPELVLRNKGTAMVLVVDGEEIVGGRQNRIVNATFLVAAGAKVVLPVSCVEHGRWHEVSPRFEPGEVSYHSLKREKQAQVRGNLFLSGRPVADQGALWSSLAQRHARMKSGSQTGAMRDLYETREEALLAYERAFPYVAGALGLIVALGGRMAGADIFDQPRTAEVLWRKLVRSYALDALDSRSGAPVEHDRALRFLARTYDARCEVYPSIGLGDDVRLQGDGAVGAALVYRTKPIYVSLFRTDGGDTLGGGRMTRASARRSRASRPSSGAQTGEM